MQALVHAGRDIPIPEARQTKTREAVDSELKPWRRRENAINSSVWLPGLNQLWCLIHPGEARQGTSHGHRCGDEAGNGAVASKTPGFRRSRAPERGREARNRRAQHPLFSAARAL